MGAEMKAREEGSKNRCDSSSMKSCVPSTKDTCVVIAVSYTLIVDPRTSTSEKFDTVARSCGDSTDANSVDEETICGPQKAALAAFNPPPEGFKCGVETCTTDNCNTLFIERFQEQEENGKEDEEESHADGHKESYVSSGTTLTISLLLTTL